MSNAISWPAPCHVVVTWVDHSPNTRLPVLCWTYDGDSPVPWYLLEGRLWPVPVNEASEWAPQLAGVDHVIIANGPIPTEFA